ncbi:3-oxoacyl-ACP synthase [Lishizhenia sp.]|uniref:3-oxoacyl-ACP synthase n=1 Tax=Lishizhenia sp. TaxID=2497594 RepID=UPI00299EB5EB|nr:3-oxoacyl-ACP synthase [Lishizhenia sp.]MDX1446176.1 3-oxoacyl-ACP synthase [Lishizhenia sp.]
MDTLELKKALQGKMLETVEEQLKSALERMDEALEAVQSETKSTAGDKHETGRAMAQLEQEKAGKIIQATKQNKNRVQSLPLEKMETVSLGAVVETNKGAFYISLAMGKVVLEGKTYFAVSPTAPIVQAMLGMKVGDEFVFNGMKQNIEKIF